MQKKDQWTVPTFFAIKKLHFEWSDGQPRSMDPWWQVVTSGCFTQSLKIFLKITLDLSCFENAGFKNSDLWVFRQPVNRTFLKLIPSRDQLIKGCSNLFEFICIYMHMWALIKIHTSGVMLIDRIFYISKWTDFSIDRNHR